MAMIAGLAVLLAAGGCGTNKPKPDQVFLMPAPGIYEEGQIHPFIDNDPIGEGLQPAVLFATDRAVAAPDDGKYDYYSHERSAAPGERFAAEIRERLARSGKKGVYVYVHGYKVNFENPVLVASELWHFLGYKGAFVAYSWPTKFSVWAYVADLGNAESSARNLRTLLLEIARIDEVEKIHVIGYSAGTRIVSRVLADLGMYAHRYGKEEIAAGIELGNVILIGSDVDRDIMSGYLLDGALRVPDSLTLYQSQDDGALNMSKKVYRHSRSGQMVVDGPLSPQAESFFAAHPQLRIIDVTNAEGGTDHGGHSYFRTSPWVSSDILMTLMYGLSPGERGLVKYEDFPVWDFPDDYVTRLRSATAAADQAVGEAIRQYDGSLRDEQEATR